MQQNPYDFITSTAPKKRGLQFGGNDQKSRIIKVALFGGIILVAIIAFFVVLGSINKSSTASLLELAANQQDIIDITKDGSTNLHDSTLITKAATVSVVVTSQKNQTIKLLAAAGNKKPTGAITKLQDTSYQQSLLSAKNNGNYDDVFTTLLANRLDQYRVQLQKTYNDTKSQDAKNQLSDFYQALQVFVPAQN